MLASPRTSLQTPDGFVVARLLFGGTWLTEVSPSRQIPSHGSDLFATTYALDFMAVDERALIEKYVPGTEVAVSVVDTGQGPRALPPVEVVSEGQYDFDARYNPGRSEYFVPARLSPELIERVQGTAMTVHRTLGLGNLSRTDLILDDAGTPWFVDVNVVPGMTETSLLPLAAEADGDLPGLYDALVHHPLVHP